MKYAKLILRLLLGVLLIYSGREKLFAWSWFHQDVLLKMDLFPPGTAGLIAAIVPGLEVVVGLALVFGVFLRAATGLAALLFGGFFLVVARALYLGIPGSCGCFGPDSDYPVDGSHAGMNSLAALVLVWMFFSPDTWCSLDQVFGWTRRVVAGDGDGK